VLSAHESAESEGQERAGRLVGAQSVLYFTFPFTFDRAMFDELAANVDRAQTLLWQRATSGCGRPSGWTT
jgi:hypothetical protein